MTEKKIINKKINIWNAKSEDFIHYEDIYKSLYYTLKNVALFCPSLYLKQEQELQILYHACKFRDLILPEIK